jgi:organic hydroperoxide reductase OsmC/OhrA
MKTHQYVLSVEWTGNKGTGTSAYTAYDRTHVISGKDKPALPASSDPAFRGDRQRYNPEELLVASISSCHMLWYLHLCAEAGIIVTAYADEPVGTMQETADGGGHFTEVVLHPVVGVADASMQEQAASLHNKAHSLCFIARSVNFPVTHQPVIRVQQ